MTPEAAWAEAMKFENRPNPYPFFDELRKTPVTRVMHGIYAVTGYQELVALSEDPRVSSDSKNSPLGQATKAKAEDQPALVSACGAARSMIQSDPPDHDRMRRMAMRHFGPPHSRDIIPTMEPWCKQVCNTQLDNVRGKTRMDIVDEYAYLLPVTVICRIMGVPVEDEGKIHKWVAAGLAGIDFGAEAATEEGKAASDLGKKNIAAFSHYMAGLIEGWMKEPGEGMISAMLHDDSGPDGPMSPEEALGNASLIFLAGHDSTVNLISHCVLEFLRNPWSLELLRNRRDLIPRAVEEVLRLESAVQFFPSRSATDDIEIAGTVIPKGSPVHLMYGAANRDPSRFSDPNKFDPERRDNEHFGWGSGIHTCFGGPLARLEVNLGLEAFLNRVENPRLVEDPPEYRRSNVFRGPRHLFIDYDRIRD
jgi:fatty acid omega-hydroxylase